MPPPTDDDVSDIGRDPALLEVFYRRHVEAVSRFVARRVDDPHLAADLTTEVFLAAMASAHTYRGGPGGPRAWLYGVARNVVAGERRRSAREAETARRLAEHRCIDTDDIERLEERIDAKAEARHVYRTVRRLSPGDRAILELVAVDGLSVTEAAHVLGMNTVAARVRLHRARRRLAAVLARPAPSAPDSGTRHASESRASESRASESRASGPGSAVGVAAVPSVLAVDFPQPTEART